MKFPTKIYVIDEINEADMRDRKWEASWEGTELLQKNWVYKDVDESEVIRLIQQTGISKAMAKVFVSRGMVDGSQVKEFLQPDAERMHDPFLMDGMHNAVETLVKTMEASRAILIYGDYDVDGVSGTSILYNFLVSRGANVQYFIPDRMEDGYGLTMSSVEKVKSLAVDLVVTVDCGITSLEEVASLTEAGMQVVVTDHHECREVLPEAIAVLNPHKPGCGYPHKELCGAGVALKLVQALCIKTGCGKEHLKYLDLAALATIADMVPLRGENRIIASLGLKAMDRSANPGLRALIRASGLGEKPVSSYGVAFGLAPRVNAAGRLGSAARSVRLFTTDNPVLADALAKELDSENKIRQETENNIINEAIAFVEEKLDPVREKVLVIRGEGWHHGVIGIVASKVLERYNRPCIIISVEEGIGKGSGRSIPGLNLFKALTACEDLMERFGGHEMAAGLTIQADRIDELRRRLNEFADGVMTEADLLPCVRVDAFLDDSDLNLNNAGELVKMAPFGLGNPGPVFGCTAMTIAELKTLSAGKHLKLLLRCSTMIVEAIGFNMGGFSGTMQAADVVDVIFSMEVNSWNGSERLQLNLKDVKPCVYLALDKNIVFDRSNDYNRYIGKLQEFFSLHGYCRLKAEELVPQRNELEAVYRYIRTCSRSLLDGSGKQVVFPDLFETSSLISKQYGVTINYFKLKKCIEIFQELGILAAEPMDRKGMTVTMPEQNGKAELEESALFKELQSLKQNFMIWPNFETDTGLGK